MEKLVNLQMKKRKTKNILLEKNLFSVFVSSKIALLTLFGLRFHFSKHARWHLQDEQEEQDETTERGAVWCSDPKVVPNETGPVMVGRMKY